MKRLALAVLCLGGCWAEVFLPAEDTDTSGGEEEEPLECEGDDLLCEGACIDPNEDAAHCGGCGDACEDDEVCAEGECVFECDCDPVGEVCDGEACVCREGLERCGDACVPLYNDPLNCGECGIDCDDEVCSDFLCEPDCGDLEACGAACVDVELDPLNCGECGHECDGDELCVFGVCRAYEPIEVPCDDCSCGDVCEPLDQGLMCCVSELLERAVCLDTPVCP